MGGRFVRVRPDDSRNRKMVWVRDDKPAPKLPPPAWDQDPHVVAVIRTVRDRLERGEHPTLDEIRALVEASTCALLTHRNGGVRVQATRELAGLLKHTERLSVQERNEAKRTERVEMLVSERRERAEAESRRQAEERARVTSPPRLRLPK